jgi:hypothetical protein
LFPAKSVKLFVAAQRQVVRSSRRATRLASVVTGTTSGDQQTTKSWSALVELGGLGLPGVSAARTVELQVVNVPAAGIALPNHARGCRVLAVSRASGVELVLEAVRICYAELPSRERLGDEFRLGSR